MSGSHRTRVFAVLHRTADLAPEAGKGAAIGRLEGISWILVTCQLDVREPEDIEDKIIPSLLLFMVHSHVKHQYIN